jgi:hypothetical protein
MWCMTKQCVVRCAVDSLKMLNRHRSAVLHLLESTHCIRRLTKGTAAAAVLGSHASLLLLLLRHIRSHLLQALPPANEACTHHCSLMQVHSSSLLAAAAAAAAVVSAVALPSPTNRYTHATAMPAQ